MDGFHDGERRSTYSAENFVSVGPEAGRGTGLPPPFSRAREECERGGPRLVGLHRAGLAERDAARLAVAPETEHPGPRTVRLDAKPLAAVDRDRRMAMTEIVNAQRPQPRRCADRVPFPVHRCRSAAGRREHPGAVGPARPRGQDGAGGRREPDCARAGLAVRQNSAVPVHVLPPEPQRLGLARAGVEQEVQRGDGNRVIRFRAVERPTERGELVVRQVVRLEARLAPPQSLARVGVLAPQSERMLSISTSLCSPATSALKACTVALMSSTRQE